MSLSALTICTVTATVLYVVWLIIFIKNRHSYDGLLDNVSSKIFTLKELYFVGLSVIELYETITKKRIVESDSAAKKLKDMSIIFGQESAEMYYYIYRSANISLVLSLVPAGLLIGCAMGSALGLVCGILMAGVLIYSVTSSIKSAIEREKDSIVDEFPQMISKLTMLVNAGMLVRRAWDEVANSNFEFPIYREMRTASKDMIEGKSVEAAMSSFAERCGVKEIRKFASVYVQAVNRGASESIDSMKIMADEAWYEKKQLAKQKGEIASQKLLIPNMIMFLGIMIVVVVPMVISTFSSFSM